MSYNPPLFVLGQTIREKCVRDLCSRSLEDIASDFLEGFSGHFLHTKRKRKPGGKIRDEIRRLRYKNRENLLC